MPSALGVTCISRCLWQKDNTEPKVSNTLKPKWKELLWGVRTSCTHSVQTMKANEEKHTERQRHREREIKYGYEEIIK